MASVRERLETPELVSQIIAGDSAAEEELFRRYRNGVSMLINRIIRNQTITEDLSQETFVIVLKKIRSGELREPAKLSAFVCNTAKNHAIDFIRRARLVSNEEDSDICEYLRDPALDPLQQLCRKEIEDSVRQIIDELPVERDRQVLFRFYIADEEKERICTDMSFGSQQFDKIIHRAKNRFKELYLKRLAVQ